MLSCRFFQLSKGNLPVKIALWIMVPVSYGLTIAIAIIVPLSPNLHAIHTVFVSSLFSPRRSFYRLKAEEPPV